MQTEPKHAIEIQTVTNRRELKQFIRFPLDLYKGCDKWVPAFEDDEFKTLGPDNPSLSFCEKELFLARKDGVLAGRVIAWGKAKGCTKIKGPLGFSDMDREGLLVNKIPAKMIKFATL